MSLKNFELKVVLRVTDGEKGRNAKTKGWAGASLTWTVIGFVLMGIFYSFADGERVVFLSIFGYKIGAGMR